MKLVDFFCTGHRMTKEYLDYDAQDKSFLKAKPEEFSRQEGRQLNILMERLNVSLNGTSIRERLSAQSEIDKMLNKSKGHLDCFLLKAQKDESSCSYLIEKTWFNEYGNKFIEQPEMKTELVNFIRNYVVDEIIEIAYLVNKQKKSSEKNKGNDIVSGGSSYSKDLNYGGAIIKLLKENISKAAKTNEIFKPLISGGGVEHISSDLANYINKQASYTVEPEKFKGLIMTYYENHAQSLNLPSVEELDVLVNSVVEKFGDVKSLLETDLRFLVTKPPGARNAIYISNFI